MRYRRSKKADACVRTCWRSTSVKQKRGSRRFKAWKACLETCYTKAGKPRKRRRARRRR